MRTMYDAVTPANLPAGGDLYAGYVDGGYANVAAIRARFPGAKVVTITVVGGSTDADVVDVEKGDVVPEHAPAWVQQQRSRGKNPTVYCSTSAWPAVRAAFAAQHVPEPNYWVANYSSGPAIPFGAVAHQWGGTNGHDVSSVADYWPGVDAAPAPIPPSKEITPMHSPPLALRPIVADCACPTGGAWLLGDDGGVYNFGGAPFEGTPAGQSYWVGRTPALIEASKLPGKVYDVVATSGERYSYP